MKRIYHNTRYSFCNSVWSSQLFGIDIWFYCPREISSGCIELHLDAMKIGEVDYAMYSLQLAWRYKIMGGENLSVALKAVGDRVQLMVRVFSIIDWKPFDVCDLSHPDS